MIERGGNDANGLLLPSVAMCLVGTPPSPLSATCQHELAAENRVTVRKSEGRMGDDSDEQSSSELLLAQVASGDQRAFAALYDRISPRVFGLLRRLVVDHAQSEEVLQEVFLEIWQTASRFDPNKGGASTWIMTMAHRRAVDRIRSAQAGRNRDLRIGTRDLDREYDHVAESAEISIENERVGIAMAKLSEAHRLVISMTYYGGLRQSEVASALGIPLGTVKTRLRDGMIRLRDELGVLS
jgi:RNA polymerase sigma-70 factor, ECF subfamily